MAKAMNVGEGYGYQERHGERAHEITMNAVLE